MLVNLVDDDGDWVLNPIVDAGNKNLERVNP